MESLNSYLTILVQQNGNEVRLEPNQCVQLFAYGGKQDLTSNPVTGAEISTAIFPVIPAIERQKLPNQPDVRFDYDLSGVGKFSFIVRKSPSGFIVSIKPLQNETEEQQTAPRMDKTIPNMMPDFSALSKPSDSFKEQTPQMSSSIETQSPETPSSPIQDFFSSSPKPPKRPFPQSETQSEPYSFFTPSSQQTQQHETQIFSQEQTFESTPDPVTEPVYNPVTSKSPFSIDFDFETGYVQPKNQQSSSQTFTQPPQPQEPVYTPSAPSIHEPVVVQVQSNKERFQSPVEEKQSDAFSPAQVKDAAVQKMEALFKQMAEMGASDIHLCVGMPPLVRKDGKMMVLDLTLEAMTNDDLVPLLTSIMPQKNREEFTKRNDTDFAYEIIGTARYRSNIFADRKGMGGVFRLIPHKILTAEQLGLSQAILKLCQLTKGLVVVTGPTGSGKSTTLCAMIDYVNRTRDDHIITIEDPIEFVHENKRCLINQREVFTHTDSFRDALRAALREDPDIILVGEMRDLETISTAIETAETGHLVFGTLHTTTAASTVDRIIDQFPTDRQSQIRVMLSEGLRGVISQTLLRKKAGGRVAALEVLIITTAISNLIREGKTFQIASSIQTGKALGMVSLNDALFELVKNGTVEADEAYSKAADKNSFESMLSRNNIPLSVKI